MTTIEDVEAVAAELLAKDPEIKGDGETRRLSS